MPRLFSIKPALTLKGRKFKGLRGFAGKPFHPPLTDIPVACYVLVAVFDVISFVSYSRNEESTLARDFFISGTHVIVVGAIASVPTIITGFWDWLKSTPPRTQAWRTANWHMAVMLTMSMVVALNILLRLGYWEGGYAEPLVTGLSVLIGLLVSFGALYGGALVYEYQFNVESLDGRVWEEHETDVYPADKQ
ncbi:MAG: DUF2231 domain-containing protein [Actinomycetota bacterium]